MSMPPETTIKELCLKVCKRYNIPFEKLVFVRRIAHSKIQIDEFKKVAELMNKDDD